MSAVSFAHASKAAEKIVDLLCSASYFAEDGKADESESSLKAAWALEKHFGPTVRENVDRLAAVSDGVIRHHTATSTQSYASAHEAVVEICATSYLVFHVRAERVWDGLAIDGSLLRARIHRERAKLLQSEKQESETKTGEQLAVYTGCGRVRIGDEMPFKLSEQYAVVLETLIELGAADTHDLEWSGGGAKKLREMLVKFPQLKPFVSTPGRKGGGGYGSTIRDGRGQ